MAPSPSSKIKSNIRWLPALLAVLVVVQLVGPYRGWLILIIGLGGAWLSAWLWIRALARGLVLTRQIRYGWAQVGDRLEERFTLVNQSLVPALWVEVQDLSTLPDYLASQVRSVDGGSRMRWTTEGVCGRRGQFRLGPTRLRTGDPFGLFTLQIDFPASTAILVLPPILPLPAVEIAPGGRAGEGRRRRPATEPTISASAVRPFQPADGLRWIHWPTTARRNELHVRLFDGTPAGDWWIFLDLEERMQSGQSPRSTDEDGVLLAASLADRGLRSGQAVGLASNSAEPIWLPPQLGAGRRWEILRSLAVADRGRYSLGELLVRARAAVRRQSSLIIVTPALEGLWVDALLPLILQGAAPTVLLLDRTAYGGPVPETELGSILSEMAIPHAVIRPELLDRPEARPGTTGRWEWRTTPAGRAVPIQRPAETPWRTLT